MRTRWRLPGLTPFRVVGGQPLFAKAQEGAPGPLGEVWASISRSPGAGRSEGGKTSGPQGAPMLAGKLNLKAGQTIALGPART